jgi:hypothetical protein
MYATDASRSHQSRRPRQPRLHLRADVRLLSPDLPRFHPEDASTPSFVFESQELNDTSESYPPAPGEMSLPEKDLLCLILNPEPPLPFPLHPLTMARGPEAQEYEIPQEKRLKILRDLYPFFPTPTLDTRIFDLHQQSHFMVREFRVIRERNRNILVSPYYPQSGGTVLDWILKDDD